MPYAASQALIAVLRDAAEGWYEDGGLVLEDRVYDGVGHRFSKDMVEDAVRFLVDAVAEGAKEKAKI